MTAPPLKSTGLLAADPFAGEHRRTVPCGATQSPPPLALTLTVALVLAKLTYRSTATSSIRCDPGLSCSECSIWSLSVWYCLTPSIQSSRRWIPAGELPEPLIVTDPEAVAPGWGEHSFARIMSEPGGAQLVAALVLMPTTIDDMKLMVWTRSCRESRLRSRASTAPVVDPAKEPLAWVNEPSPVPSQKVDPPPLYKGFQ